MVLDKIKQHIIVIYKYIYVICMCVYIYIHIYTPWDVLQKENDRESIELLSII